MGQNLSSAVMAQRHEAPDSLDYFPTPPWATRALLAHVLPQASGVCLEPACGEGHMARPLAERFDRVIASDIHDYGYGEVRDFLVERGSLLDRSPAEEDAVDWVITNPPFKEAESFIHRAVDRAAVGCAMLVRSSFLEGVGRYTRLFEPMPPAVVAQFTERVVMHKGRLSPKGSTATAYCWIVWRSLWCGKPEIRWIPPCRKALERPEDYQ